MVRNVGSVTEKKPSWTSRRGLKILFWLLLVALVGATLYFILPIFDKESDDVAAVIMGEQTWKV